MAFRKIVGFIFGLFFLFIAAEAQAGSFTIGSGAFKEGCPISVPIIINTASIQSDAANIIIHYNPNEIEILDSSASQNGIQIAPGSAYSIYADNFVDPNAGLIRLTGFSIGMQISGSGLFGSIPLQSKPGITSSNITVEFVPGSTLDSNIAEFLTSDDVLTSVTDSALTFVPGPCTADTRPPAVSLISPANAASNIALNSSVSFHITDNQSGVDLDSLRVDVNGTVYTKTGANTFTYAGTPLNYTITVNPATDFPANAEVVVRV
ncbi:MAG: hypothetical protein WCJ29_00565, partial [bacterium]